LIRDLDQFLKAGTKMIRITVSRKTHDFASVIFRKGKKLAEFFPKKAN
jgi:hypothetical protein